MRQVRRHVNEVALLRASTEFAALPPANFAFTLKHISNCLLLSVMMDARLGSGFNGEDTTPEAGFNPECWRERCLSFRSRCLRGSAIELRRADNCNGDGVGAHLRLDARMKVAQSKKQPR